jgi:hypothetical protein
VQQTESGLKAVAEFRVHSLRNTLWKLWLIYWTDDTLNYRIEKKTNHEQQIEFVNHILHFVSLSTWAASAGAAMTSSNCLSCCALHCFWLGQNQDFTSSM